MGKIWKILFIVTLALLVVAGGSLGYLWQKTSNKVGTINERLISVQDDLESKSQQLDAIQEVYPPSDFSSISELEGWVSTHIQLEKESMIETFKTALRVQEDGLRDGYLISIMIDYQEAMINGVVFCASLVDGALYAWSPTSDEVFHFYSEFRR